MYTPSLKAASYLHLLPFIVDGMLYRDPDAIFVHVILDLWGLQFLDFDIIGPACFYGGRIDHFFGNQVMRNVGVPVWME